MAGTPLADRTLRDVLQELGDENVRTAGLLLQTLWQQFGLTISYATAPVRQVMRDEWLEHVRAGRAYRFSTQLTGAAGFNAQLQVFNPLTSGKQLLVHRAWVGTVATADRVVLARHNAALSQLSLAEPLLVNGPGSSAEARFRLDAGVLGTVLAHKRSGADRTEGWEGWIAEVPPGFGVHVTRMTVATVIDAGIEWAEVPL